MAAQEYSNAEYKIYNNGYFKFSRSGKHSVFIEEIYVEPHFRNSPVSQMIMESFNDYLKEQKIFSYYGYVMKSCPKYKKRMSTFQAWGLKITDDNEFYTTVFGNVRI